MNFSTAHRKTAEALPKGHRAIVYLQRPYKRFVWAIEFVGSAEDGAKVRDRWGIPPDEHAPYTIYRPIRFLAQVRPEAAPSLADVERATGFAFNPNSFTHKKITGDVYRRIFGAIPWEWTAADGAVAPSDFAPRQKLAPLLPGFPGAARILERLTDISGLPERNNEEVVRDFLVTLGWEQNEIQFQRGRIDLALRDATGRVLAVFEVKRSLDNRPDREQARRQAFDYARRVGARLVVVTDADMYEVYDQTAGIDYESCRRGQFQLTRWRVEDETSLALLRPSRT